MVRLVLKDGVFVPTEPLPADWHDGHELCVEPDETAEPEVDIDAWLHRMNELCANVSPAETARVQAALDEQRRLAKERMRREMGLD